MYFINERFLKKIQMKKIYKLFLVAVILVATSISANAQFHFGLKAGVALNSLNFSNLQDVANTFTNKENRAAFTGGVMAEFEVPVIGLCFDASVLYVRRISDIPGQDNAVLKNNRDYIDIPVNLKYKIGLPIISKFLRPYVLTGPDFGILVSKKAIENAYKNKAFDFAWNFGAGIELLSHVQIQASYGLGLSNVIGNSDSKIEGKNRYWTVTAAYLF